MVVGMLFVKYASVFTVGFVVVMSFIEIFLCAAQNWVCYIFISLILFLVLWAHRTNLNRLMNGTENKTELLKMLKGLGKKKEKVSEQE